MTPFRPTDFNYTIMTPRFCNDSQLNLLNQVYNFWHEGWSKVYSENGAEKRPSSDDFFRQDYITAVTHQDKIAGIHFYSLYDFRTDLILKNHYVENHFNKSFVDQCRQLGFNKLMSMESLLANPLYRKSISGINFTELLASLGQKIFRFYTDADCIFTPTRVDNNTSRSAQRIGLRPIQSNVMVHNTPVDFLVCQREDILPATDPVRFYVESFWERRQVADVLLNQNIFKAA